MGEVSHVVVVGAGVVGLAAAHELTRAGHHVTVVSADAPGSRQSCGLTRIFRLAHADGILTDAAAASLALWEEWEARVGRPLLDRVGLILTGDVADREGHLARHGAVHARPRALAIRWPSRSQQWSFEATGAAILAEDTVRFLQDGLEVVLGEVVGVSATGVTLAGGERLPAERVIVCAGPDTYGLLGARRAPAVALGALLVCPARAAAGAGAVLDQPRRGPVRALLRGHGRTRALLDRPERRGAGGADRGRARPPGAPAHRGHRETGVSGPATGGRARDRV